MSSEARQKLQAPALDSRLLAEEAVRRYGLPFGIVGKHKSFKRSLGKQHPSSPYAIVVQDMRIRCPAEYIFGLEFGDCHAASFYVNDRGQTFGLDSLVASLELLLREHQVSLLIIALSESHDADQILRTLLTEIEERSHFIRELCHNGQLALDSWIIDESKRRCRLLKTFN